MKPTGLIIDPATHTACKPWCRHHDADGGICFAENTPIPSRDLDGTPGHVGLSHDTVSGTLIHLNHDTDAPLTLDEAEQVAHTLLKQVAAGRGLSAGLELDALTDAELAAALRWVQLKRQGADVYPTAVAA